MMIRTILSAGLSAGLALALFASAAVAQAPDGASAYLRGRHEEVNRLLRQPAANDAARQRRSERLNGMLNDMLAYDELSRRALRDHWEGRTPEQREQFVALLRQLVQRNYENNLERTLDFEITYDRESTRDDLTIVHTTARSRTQRRAPPVAIDYAMIRSGNTWRVVDVTTDGVSMVDNYRSQFNRIIGRDGWDELIARMQRRLESGEET
jgi:phospholipid transport system substrate-binding protein